MASRPSCESFDLGPVSGKTGTLLMMHFRQTNSFPAVLWFAVLLVAGPLRAEPVPLTPTEHAWLQAHSVIRVGVDTRQPPFLFREQDGKMIGFDMEHLQLLATRAGLTFAHDDT
jgi:ABC-type amino acid transport substrate-binding protein